MADTQERTLLDQLKDLLAAATGIPFAVDAWKNKAPENYGVVELTGQENGEWADGRMIDQAFNVVITIYVSGSSQKWKDRIQNVLEQIDAGYSLRDHGYLADIERMTWQWNATVYDPITWDEEAAVSDGQ